MEAHNATTEFEAVDNVSEIPEGATVRVGKADIIHRPNGVVTGELLTNDIENGVFHVETEDGYQPFSPSEQDGYVTHQGGNHTEQVFVAVEDTQPEVGDEVEITGDKSHHNLGKTWEVLTTTDAGHILTDENGIDTITVSKNSVEVV